MDETKSAESQCFIIPIKVSKEVSPEGSNFLVSLIETK